MRVEERVALVVSTVVSPARFRCMKSYKMSKLAAYTGVTDFRWHEGSLSA